LHWDKIFKIVNSYFDSLTAPDAEQYKINRQKAIFAEALLGKKTKIEENRFNFTEKNLLEFAPNDYHSISFSAALKEILKDKNIKVTEIKVHLVPENQLSKEPVYSIKLELFKALARGVNPYKKVLPKIEAQNSLKDVIFISEVDGIYRTRDGVNLCYPIKGNKRKNIIRNLNGKLRVEGKLLSDSYQKLSKEIAQINKLTRKNLKLPDNYNFIIRANTGGYALNDSKYEIQFVS
jgi:hypothetical protein